MTTATKLPKKATELPVTSETPHYLVRKRGGYCGGWGRASTIHVALQNAELYATDPVYICMTDEHAECDDVAGTMFTSKRGPIFEGVVMKSGTDIKITAKFRD